MIAASEPQEFVPSGRQQGLRHPGPIDVSHQKPSFDCDEFLDKFEHVSLKEKETEWWILRKASLDKNIINNTYESKSQANDAAKSFMPHYSDAYCDSFSFNSMDADLNHTNKKMSDLSKLSNHQLNDVSFKSDHSANQANIKQSFRPKSKIDYIEDELYVKGHTVIWSRGLLNSDNVDNGRKTICSYTSQLPIKHALWCTFHLEHPIYESDLFHVYDKNVQANKAMPAVCIIDAHNIRVFTPKGDDFVTAIPFQINNTWNTNFGIIIEKEIETELNTSFFDVKATLYSLAYPLDEISPIAINLGSSHIQVLNNHNFKVIFTNSEPSIAFAFDTQTKQHSLYKIRKVNNCEKMQFVNKLNNTCPSVINLSNKLKNRFSLWDCSKNQNLLPTPISSRPGSVASFYNLHNSRSHSSMATISRCQSPAASSVGSPWLQKISRLNCSVSNDCNQQINNGSFIDSSKIMSYLHTNPTICFEHIWTENFCGEQTTASKAFLCDDLIGQWYICYLISAKYQLLMIQIDFFDTGEIAVGSTSSIFARDAAPVIACHMMAVLEPSGNVLLYSGQTLVGKLYIGGTLAQHTPSPYLKRTFHKFNSPFPRRSSLLPNCVQADLKFDEHLLSPVLPENSQSNRPINIPRLSADNIHQSSSKVELSGLQDPVENRLTLCYSDGTFYRILMPALTLSPLVENCLITLRQCLGKDASLTLLTRWYATRNSVGVQEINLVDEWKLFAGLLNELIGYETEGMEDSYDLPVTPLCNPKRQKHSLTGTNSDWNFMLDSNYESELGDVVQNLLCFESKHYLSDSLRDSKKDKSLFVKINAKATLFPFIRLIHYCLHLLYEDLKLDLLRTDDLKLLAVFLNQLAGDLDLLEYSVYYWKDFPCNCEIITKSNIKNSERVNIQMHSFFDDSPPNVMNYIGSLIDGSCNTFYPYLSHCNDKTKNILQISALICKELNKNINLQQLIKIIQPLLPTFTNEYVEYTLKESSIPIQATLLMYEKNMTVRDLDFLPPGVYLLFYSALWKCRDNPPADLPTEAYMLLWREDLAAQAEKIKQDNDEDPQKLTAKSTYCNNTNDLAKINHDAEYESNDGMNEVDNVLMRLRFPDDIRVLEARRMLASSQPVPIVLVQRPDVTDHDFIEEQEKHLYAICSRTMALPPGRGMFTLRTLNPVITEPLKAPALCLSGKVPPRGTAVELHHIDTPSNIGLWPLFHNGVANGLKITPDANQIDNTWIVFNKPKASTEQSMEHAGFLMALGLNGHLKKFDILNTFNYLSKLYEMTSIGILLGLSAAYRGTSDFNMTKTLSIHIEALLPPTSMELDVHQNVQVAALLGLGLVYQGTSHRHIIEVLLSEIGRPPGPEMENSIDRESYSLAAGLSLGLVTLKQGLHTLGLSDLNVPDRLYYYMMGGNRKPLTGSQKEKYKVSSFQIREGPSVNLDVTAPGATLALGLMYLGTGNKAIADWMAAPDTQYLLDFVRPDFLMFRILSRSLILWNDIEASKEWVENQVPETIRPYCMQKPIPDSDIDFEAMNQAYCNIVTGACFALGLRFAGSADEDAFEVLIHFCHMFTNLTIKSIAEIAGKPTIETCLNVLLLSAAMVMAGTGNLEIMRLVRVLRRRIGVASSAVVSYGSHMATHMALGLLFLGGGRYTLSNSPENVAALICAFYPKFPTHSNDNRYHLQAFRHLYVLAVEPRVILPRDVHNGKLCYVNLKVVKLDGGVSHIKCPGIVPDLNRLKSISVDDERYWPLAFDRSLNWNLLTKILSSNGFIEVKQRAGCLSYIADKLGYHSQLAKTLTQSEFVTWDPAPFSITSFTQEKAIKYFVNYVLMPGNKNTTSEELHIKQLLTTITYEAVVKDKLIIIPIFTFIVKILHQLKQSPNSMNIVQVKLILAQILQNPLAVNLISPDLILAIEQKITYVLDEWENDLKHLTNAYLNSKLPQINANLLKKLATYIQFYDIPYNVNCAGLNELEVLLKHPLLSIKCVRKIVYLANL